MEHLISTWGYLAIFVLSILQSACVPTSSELTFGFAGFLAFEGHFSLPEVIVVGALGELIGGYIAWAVGLTAGRAVLARYGRLLRISPEMVDRLQAWYAKHPRWGVFATRLLPIVRNFVALTAGIAEVTPVRFGVLTFLGSLVWDGALALLGYSLGSTWAAMAHAVSDAGYVMVALVAVVVGVLYLLHRQTNKLVRRTDESIGYLSALARIQAPEEH